MTKPAILHIEGITKHFDQTTEPAVANVSFTLHEGDLLGLVGP
ncbi:MAG: ABC transporter ATP-binding protein, partial [Moorea sp. SIO2I5]|nr:ABC transporter ATP-binding protein [Moorena sp. SIO2I5]